MFQLEASADNCVIYGNFGRILVDRKTGDVLSYRPKDKAESIYADIVKFDMPLNPSAEIDIVTIGFWTLDNDYIHPSLPEGR